MRKNYFFKLLSTIVLSGIASLGFAADWYIASNGNDNTGDGSFGNPWASFSKAQTAATAGDVIHVSGMIDFTLDPANTTNNAGTTTSNKAGIALSKNLTVQGTSATTDGFTGTNGTNTTRFFQITNASYTLTLKNLKLANGVAQSTSNTAGGGAIMMTNGNVVAENLIFEGNSSIGYNGIQGAAVYIGGANTLGTSFKNCEFKNNVSDKAGAVYINTWSAGTASVPNIILFENCSFVGNEARNTGGSAIMARSANEYTTLNMINCTFSKNKVTTVSNGGTINMGAKGMRYMNMNFINCTISENTTAGSAGNGAGLVYLNTVQTSSTTPPTNNNIGNLYIKNTIIEKNTAASGVASDLVVNALSPTVPETGTMGSSPWTNGVPGYIKIENSIIGQVTNLSFIPSGNIVSSQVGYLNTNATDFKAFLGTMNPMKNYYPLLSTSHAIDYGSSTLLSAYSNKDQLGNTRPFTGDKCHAGAVEVKAIVANTDVNASALSLTALSDLIVTENKVTIDAPTALNYLTIAPGAKVTVSGTNALTATSGITLQSNAGGTATLTDGYENPTITATVEQYLPQGRNWYVGSPVETNIATTANLTAAGAASVSYYSEQSGWQHNYSGNLAEGVGYVAVSSSGTNTNKISFSGKLNSGDVPVTLTRKSTGAYAGFNLIANPYPSYINPMAAINANASLDGTIWYRTRKTASPYEYKFETVNTTSGVGTNAAGTGTVTGYIPPMQAFWVRTNADDQLFTFRNSMRDHARNVTVGEGTVPTTPLKAGQAANTTIVRIEVAGNGGSDEAVLYFDENASNGFDRYDSRKMFESATSSVPEIYSIVGREKLVINGLNAIAEDLEIPFGFNAKQTGDYVISSTGMKNPDSGTRIILRDKLNPNTEHELGDGSVYNFSSDICYGDDRFSILFKAAGTTTGLKENDKDDIRVFVNAANQITIIAPENCKYAVYNAAGVLIKSDTTNSNKHTLDISLSSGLYIVKAGNSSNRVIIK